MDNLRKGINKIKEKLSKKEPPMSFVDHQLGDVSQFEKYNKLKDYYDVYDVLDEDTGETLKQVDTRYGDSVGVYVPSKNQWFAHSYYDEAEPDGYETKDYYTKRMTALGYKPDEIEGIASSFVWNNKRR